MLRSNTSIAANYMHDFDTSMNFTHFSCAAWRASWKGQHWRNEVAYYLLLSKAASKKLICGKLKTTENLILLISSSDVKIQLLLNLVLIISSIWIFKNSHIFMVEGRPLDIFNIQCTAWHNFCRQVFSNVPYLYKQVPNLELTPTTNKHPSLRQKKLISAQFWLSAHPHLFSYCH